MSTSTLELFSLTGRTALITGATRGIGQSMALALAGAGADIILLQRDVNNTKTSEAVQALGRKCTIYEADLSQPSTLTPLVQRITSTDAHDISILINCGGIQRRHAPEAFPTADWNEVIDVNLNSVFTLCRDVGAYMLQREASHKGSIVNVGSLLSFQGGINVPAYAAAKGGVAQLTKALSNQWAGRGVNVNAIAPGYIQTDMNEALINDETRAASILERIPAGRWGSPEDFKGTVVFLTSRASLYVSGEMLTVDGGWMGR